MLCAVSGGADSMALLHWLWSEREKLGIEVAAAHFEHGLRGEESLRDAGFVEKFCKEKGIEFAVAHGDVRSYAAEQSMSIEEAARELRYKFLEETADALHCDSIATAHNANDNAETMIFNLSRGSGSLGLCGIPPMRGRIIRPLLQCTREQIEDYLRANAIPHVEDSSNAGDEYSRNLIRHHVSPVLQKINPEFAHCMGRTAELMRQDEDCLNSMAQEFIEKNFGGESIDQREFSKLHRAVASRVFRKLCPQVLSAEHVNSLLKLLEGNMLSAVDVPGARIRREQGRIYFKESPCQSLPDRELVIGEELDIPEAKLRVFTFLGESGQEINGLFNTFCLKYESISGVIHCTGRRDGDKYRPIGRNCTKSLKSLFLERKMTQTQRELCPVFRDDKGILAVCGFPADERTKAEKGDKILRIVIEKY